MTTLDTKVTEVDKIEVTTATLVGVAITQSGTRYFKDYMMAHHKWSTVGAGGSVGIGTGASRSTFTVYDIKFD